MAAFTIGEAISNGWTLTKNHWRAMGTAVLINLVIQIPASVIQEITKDNPSFFSLLVIIGIALVSMVVNYNWIRIAIGLVDGRPYTLKDFFQIQPRLLFQYALASLIFSLAIAFGTLLLIIPGIIAMLAWGQYLYIIPDKQLGAIGALKESARITSGSRWQLFLLGWVYFGMGLATIFTLGLGLIVVLPIITMSGFWVYRQLNPILS
jgi:uncharacterized membrane protein